VAAVDYLADLGKTYPGDGAPFSSLSGRRLQVHAGLAAIQAYEAELGRRLLTALADRPRFKVWGITDLQRLGWRVPTVSLTTAEHTAQEIDAHLAARNIFVWSGNLYAPGLAETLGVDRRGGFLRIGLVHYNTAGEVDQLLQALDEL
jgi:selenocysteine lyase/cysteine desulfurase